MYLDRIFKSQEFLFLQSKIGSKAENAKSKVPEV